MADPRKTLSYQGVNAEYATFKIDNSTITYDSTQDGGSSVVGRAVTLSADATVKLAGDGDAVTGRLMTVESDGFCTVLTDGFAEFPAGAGATLTLGSKIVGDLDGSGNPGFVRAVDTAVAAELGKARGAIVDASDTTAVVVNL